MRCEKETHETGHGGDGISRPPVPPLGGGSLDEPAALTSEPLTQGSRAGGELAVGSAQLIPAARCSCIWLSSL